MSPCAYLKQKLNKLLEKKNRNAHLVNYGHLDYNSDISKTII